MSNTPTFEKLSVKELQDFLRKRGVSTTGYTKPKLVKLAAAVADLNPSVNPDLAGPSHSIVGSNFEEIPDFGLYDIFNYLVCNRADYDRKKLKAYKSFEDYRLFADGHIENLQYSPVSPKILSSTRLNPQ